MSVRRGTVRLVTAAVLLAGLATAGLATATTTPARAAEDAVRLRLASGFTAGGSPGSATISVAKRTEGCVSVRTALGIRLPGLRPEQVLVEAAVAGGRWQPVPVSSGGEDLVVSQRIRPERPSLCKGKNLTVRYRLQFSDAVQNGTALLVAEAYTAGDALIARDSDSARVRGGRDAAAPTLPAVAPTSAPPTPEATTETEEVAAAAPTRSATDTVPAAAAPDDGGGMSGLTTVLIALGVGMVGIGVALMVLLIRRGRADRADRSAARQGRAANNRAAVSGFGGEADRTAVLPTATRPGRTFQSGGARPSGVQPLAGTTPHPQAPPQPGGTSGPASPQAPPRQLGQPFQVAAPGAGANPEATLILPTSVPPRRPAAPKSRPAPPAYPGADATHPGAGAAHPGAGPAPRVPESTAGHDPGPEATFILPTERAPKRRPGDQPDPSA